MSRGRFGFDVNDKARSACRGRSRPRKSSYKMIVAKPANLATYAAAA